MPVLKVSHITSYTYRQPVSFGEHRMMVRPRESYDQRLIDARLQIEPQPADLRWLHDVFGNSVAIATFDKRASSLVIESEVTVDHRPAELETVHIEEYARYYPFTYSSEEMPDLLRSIERQHHDAQRQLDAWAGRFLNPSGSTDTLEMLSAMTAAIKREFTYVSRPEKGTQTPIETLTRGKGTCRDYAVLMTEAVRALGFAARIVSGYLYSRTKSDRPLGGGNTHAWVRVYLPGSGWVEFDPTNAMLAGADHITIGYGRDYADISPIVGVLRTSGGHDHKQSVDVVRVE